MADICTKEKRSQIMRAIKGKNTRPELIVFKYLNSQNIYYQKHYKRAVGSPDVALPRKKKALFIAGDFWHGRSADALNKKNQYWQDKIKKNILRDKKQRQILIDAGWQVERVWESDIVKKSTRESQLTKIKDFLTY
jgi:DNA mismatch endonuclease (patch repair protein)